MSFNSQEWLWPPWVQTPDVVKDLVKHIDPALDEAKYQSLSDTNKKKLQTVVERIKVIDHFKNLSGNLQKRRKMEVTETPAGRNKTKKTETYHIKLWGHDFAGFDFDVDAISTYLYLTCIDTIKGHDEYKDPFEWLQEQIGADAAQGAPIDLPALKDKYSREFGLGRRFREAFTHDLDSVSRRHLGVRLAVVKAEKGNITAESCRAWEQCSDEERILRIASKFYAIRNRFSQISLRSFSPTVPCCFLENARKEVLIIRASGPSLLETLHEIIKKLTRKLLLK